MLIDFGYSSFLGFRVDVVFQSVGYQKIIASNDQEGRMFRDKLSDLFFSEKKQKKS